VAENVGFGLKVRNVNAEETRRRVNEMLEVVQLGALRDRYPAELSGGQQQRVALARSIVVKPSVLLLDEPLSNLDANLREEMRFEIRRLHDEFRMTMVYVTHDQAEAMVTSDRIAVMNQGHLEQVDAPYEMYHRPKTKFVAGFIGRTNFLKGTRRDGAIDFGGFAVPWQPLNSGGGSGAAEVLASIRPQSIRLSRVQPAAAAQRCCIEASVQRRAYLGESWDYHVAFAAPTEPLRVAAGPGEVFQVGEKVFAQIDTSQITLVS
jgi:ABC-type Fe3+/spermidine/putrescine transport system ATPase subunit